MKFRKKPVVIDAVQYNGLNHYEIRQFAGLAVMVDISDTAYEAGAGRPIAHLYIDTLEGRMEALKGDYIIRGVNGEFYPCKPDIFAKTYEPVGEE